ncbi:type III effector [Gemmobacter aquarius]|uniref:Type III effector n=1 Tax=Paragemmobacter aquarius TaxID=2169400 RepID=A0A2S0UNQ9_9RHOB|nr:four-carbon acid sugar kinase family protein [Gemmobacter aquarius]AWB49454.1 type III effector [Gemmobacter aquarius]
MTLPEGVLLTWYGDDFTGSAAVLEALDFAGLPAVMFLGIPAPEVLARFAGVRAVGIAGDARTRGPEWMEAHLPAIYASLRAMGGRVMQYKLCSTFDSAPHLGSIGKAAELGIGDWAPMVVAAPKNGRWQVFGTLFAKTPDGVARLDRHPTMSVHPATPMHEADVRRHLAAQTALPVGLVDVLALQAGRAAVALEGELAKGARIVAFDVLDQQTLAEAGRVIWERAMEAPVFALGSQGLNEALIAHWDLPKPALRLAGAAGRIAVVSGSCSPDTARQIGAAEAAGFAGLRIAAERVVDAGAWAAELARVETAALAALAEGRSPLVYSAMGPQDPALVRVAEARAAAGMDAATATARLSQGLGAVLARLVAQEGLGRVVIAGGDTSSLATAELGCVALTAKAAIAQSVPLLAAHFADGRTPLELVLKGGQMGEAGLFAQIRDGIGG